MPIAEDRTLSKRRRGRTAIPRSPDKTQNSNSIGPSPIQRLPFELVGEIMKASYYREISTQARNRHLIELVLVCRAWCRAAYSSYCLWTSLEVDRRPGPIDNTISFLVNWFSHSGVLPCDLKLNLRWNNDGEAENERLSTYITQFRRWRSLVFECPSSAFLRSLLRGFQGSPISYPFLETFEPRLCKWTPGPLATNALDVATPFFRNAPNLSKLSLCLPDSLDSQVWLFPWHQITDLNLSTQTDCKPILGILASCPRLTSVSVVFDVEEWRNDTEEAAQRYELPPPTPIVLAHLVSLEIRYPPSFEEFFRPLVLPSLSALSLEGSYELPRAGALPLKAPLLDMLDRSRCSVTHLCLIHIRLSDDDFISLFRRMPHISSLVWQNVHVLCMTPGPSVFVALNREKLLPKLSHIFVSGSRAVLGVRDLERFSEERGWGAGGAWKSCDWVRLEVAWYELSLAVDSDLDTEDEGIGEEDIDGDGWRSDESDGEP